MKRNAQSDLKMAVKNNLIYAQHEVCRARPSCLGLKAYGASKSKGCEVKPVSDELNFCPARVEEQRSAVRKNNDSIKADWTMRWSIYCFWVLFQSSSFLVYSKWFSLANIYYAQFYTCYTLMPNKLHLKLFSAWDFTWKSFDTSRLSDLHKIDVWNNIHL